MASFQVTEGEWSSCKYHDVLGAKIPIHFTKDPALLADFITNFQTRPDDVFVASYPKSGMTWLQEIVWQIHNEGAVSSEHQLFRCPYLEVITTFEQHASIDVKTRPSPRLLRSHFTYSTFPKSANEDAQCKYIYVARNPKDVAVSYFHFMEPFKVVSGYSGPWEFFAKLFIDGNVWYDSWNEHVLGWWKHKDDPNVLFLKYEDLRKDLLSHVRMIAEFLNKPLSEEVINRIAEQCTFKGMKKNEISYTLLGFEEEDASPIVMLRKGVVGDWKNYFTPELNERFEKEVLAKLKGSGLEFDFET